MSALTDAQLQALSGLETVWPDAELTLLGGSALVVHFGVGFPRFTEDLDLVVSISLDDYPGELARRPGWTRGKHEHQWRSPAGVKVDVLPAGPRLLAIGKLVWPGSGHEMNLAGLRHAFARGVPLPGAPGVRLASRATLALLKVVAYLDRPSERGRDLEDLELLLRSYVEEDDLRRWEDGTEGVDYDETPAFLLGRDLGTLVDAKERQLVEAFLVAAIGPGADGSIQARMLRSSPGGWDADRLVKVLEALGSGLRSRTSRDAGSG